MPKRGILLLYITVHEHETVSVSRKVLQDFLLLPIAGDDSCDILRGTGAYTAEDVNILYIALSQYEVNLLRHVIREFDPNAFLIVKDHVKIYGNYQKKL